MADEELKVTEQADGSVVVGDVAPPKEELNDDDAPAVVHEDDEEGTPEESAEDAEARRERNRARRKENKEHRRSHIESLKREIAARDSLINDMGQRLSVVERRATGSDMAQVDVALGQANEAYNYFKQQVQVGVERADGKLASEATEKMIEARKKFEQLQGIKQAMGRPQQQAPALDPRLINHAQEWMSRNQWYDPAASDADSHMVMSLDDRLAKEGWDPKTDEYWQELDARVKKYLPHKTNKGYNVNNSAPRVPVAGSSRNDSANASGGYKLSAERVHAMKEAGIYDDPKKRADMIRRYQEQDRQNGNR